MWFEVSYLSGVVSQQLELAWDLAPGELAAVVVHAPGAAEGEGGSAGFLFQALTRTRPPADQGGRPGRKTRGSVQGWRFQMRAAQLARTLCVCIYIYTHIY